MKNTNRIIAVLLAAAILFGFYVPTTRAEAATAVESLSWGFTEESRANGWSPTSSWIVADGKLVTNNVDINQLQAASISYTRAVAWNEFTTTVDVTVCPQGYNTEGGRLNYASFGVQFYSGGKSSLRLQVVQNQTGSTVGIYYSKTGTYLVSKKISVDNSADFQNYTLTLSVSGSDITANIGYTNTSGNKATTTLSANVADETDLKPGGLVLTAFRTVVPGGEGTYTLAEDGLYYINADINSVTAQVYSYNVVNDGVVENPETYVDGFNDHAVGDNPDYWVEDNGVDAFAVAANPSSAAAAGCLAPSGNAYKYTGTDYARSWLHVFETNVHYTVKIFVPEGTTSGQVGLIARMSGLEVPGHVKVGYDFDKGVWFCEDGRGAESDFGQPFVTTAEGEMATGQWHTVRVYIVNRQLKLYCDDMNTPVMNIPVYQVTTGRVGVFAEGVSEAYFDDVNFKLLSGQGRVEAAVLENYVLDPEYTGYTEGGSIIRYDENTLLLNTSGRLYISTDNGVTFTKLDMSLAENKKYSFFNMGLPQFIRLHNGYLLKLVTSNGNVTTVLSKDNGASSVTVNEKLYNIKLDGVITTGNGYYGGMNDMLKEVNLGDIDGDGQDNYRVFYCADVRTTGVEGNTGTNITYHWQEVYYTDDFGYTWNKAEFDTRWYSGLDHICESKIMPVYNADGSLKCVRIFCTWNDGRAVRYFDSYDYGKTWTSEKALPELTGGRNSFPYAIDKETGYIYIAYPYGVPANDEDIMPRNRFVLMRSKDATNWEYVMDLWRWEDVPADEHTNINQIVDPSMTIDGDYIYVTSGWSEWRTPGSPHNAQRQTMIRLDKNKLTAYDAFPITPDNKAITYVEVTAPRKWAYLMGEEIDLTGGYLTVHYYDGSTKQVSLTDESVTIQRPDASWLWTSEFDTEAYPLTGKAGKQWIRVEYIEPDKGFNDGFADGFFIQVAETEDELAHILFNSADGMTAEDWETKDGWSVADNVVTAQFDATSGPNTFNTLIAENTAKWSGYTVSADITSYLQTGTNYTNAALRLGVTENGFYEVRISSLSTSGCTVTLRNASANLCDPVNIEFANALTAVDNGLTVHVAASLVGGKLVVCVEGMQAVSCDVDNYNGGIGLFVYRNDVGGTAKVTVKNLKVTAPSVRNFYDAALEDKISLNIHMGLSDVQALDPGIFMKFILNGVESIAKPVVGENNDFAFTVGVAAKEMADPIVAQLYNSTDGLIAQHTTTLKDYASYIVNTDGYELRYKDIAQALLNYGAAAQLHFKHNTGDLANGGFQAGWNSGIDVSELAKYAPKASGTQPEGVQFYGSSLIMEDRTTIRHYFKMDDATAANVQASLYGQALKLQSSGNFYYVDITGVDAANLDYAYTLELTDGKDTFAVTYSALSYVYQILSTESYSGTTMEQLAQALFLYNKAVDLEPSIGDDEFEILPF